MQLTGPVLISGGGIGGLAAALALSQKGFEVEVYERRPDREIQLAGTGLTIWSNATTALSWLGLTDEVLRLGMEISHVRNVTEQGDLIFGVPVARYTHPGSIPGVSIARGDLVEMLLTAAEKAGVKVHFGHAVTGYVVGPRGVTITLDNGVTATGALLVGADGISSAVHNQLLGGIRKVYTGLSAFRGLSDSDGGLEPGVVYLVTARSGVSGGAWRVSGDRMAWTLGRRAEPDEPEPPEGRKARVLALISDFREASPLLVSGTPAERVLRTDIYYHEWTDRWGAGPVTLLGDAAHAVPTVLGQGACQAIEDAVVLADALASARDPVQGLRDYEARRTERVRWIRTKILSLMSFPPITNPVLLWLGLKALRVVTWFTREKMWCTLQQPPQLNLVPGAEPLSTRPRH